MWSLFGFIKRSDMRPFALFVYVWVCNRATIKTAVCHLICIWFTSGVHKVDSDLYSGNKFEQYCEYWDKWMDLLDYITLTDTIMLYEHYKNNDVFLALNDHYLNIWKKLWIVFKSKSIACDMLTRFFICLNKDNLFYFIKCLFVNTIPMQTNHVFWSYFSPFIFLQYIDLRK